LPLQNRVTPFGDLVDDVARGLFMGNRGGRIHAQERTLSSRRWVSRQWICCRLAFKGRRREVWGASYTELFFLDEPTALAAGHRPCFECRRAEAQAFAAAYAVGQALAQVPRAAEMDNVLHRERLDGRAKRMHASPIDGLPDGAFIAGTEQPEIALALRGNLLLEWTPAGYRARHSRPAGVVVNVLTPPAIVGALAAGYQPLWHPSADT
jgi:hypothetical protein